jgi:hypothetical protein
MSWSFLLSLLSLFLTLSSLPSPILCLNGTMRLTAVTMSAAFPLRQEAGVASYPRAMTFRTATGATVAYPAGFIVMFGGETASRAMNDGQRYITAPPHLSSLRISCLCTPLTLLSLHCVVLVLVLVL